MPCQMPPTRSISSEERRAITRSMPGRTPSLRTPRTSPVNAVGSVPRTTVSPCTTWSGTTSAVGNGTAQSPVAAAECAAVTPAVSMATVGAARTKPVRRAIVALAGTARRLMRCSLFWRDPRGPASLSASWADSLTPRPGIWLSGSPRTSRAVLRWQGEPAHEPVRPTPQPRAGGGGRAGGAAGRDGVRREPRPRPWRGDVRVGDHHRPGLPGRAHVPRRAARQPGLGDGQRHRRRCRPAGPRPAAHHDRSRREPHRRGRRDALPQRRRGPAPRGRPGRRTALRLRDDVPGRRAEHLRLLRPARPQGHLDPPRPRAARLDRDRQLAGHRGRAGTVGPGDHPPAVDVPRRPGRRARTTWCAPSTTASRWGSAPAPRWPGTSTTTPRSCSP